MPRARRKAKPMRSPWRARFSAAVTRTATLGSRSRIRRSVGTASGPPCFRSLVAQSLPELEEELAPREDPGLVAPAALARELLRGRVARGADLLLERADRGGGLLGRHGDGCLGRRLLLRALLAREPRV